MCIGWASGCVFPVIPIIWIESQHRHTALFYQSPESVLLACLHGPQVARAFVCCGVELGTRMCSVKSIVDSDMTTSRGVAVAAPDRFTCMDSGSPQEGGKALSSPREGKVNFCPLRPQFLVKCFQGEGKLHNDGYTTSWILLYMDAGIPLFIHSLTDKCYFVCQKLHLLIPRFFFKLLDNLRMTKNLFLSQNYDAVRIFQVLENNSICRQKMSSQVQLCLSFKNRWIYPFAQIGFLNSGTLSWGVHTEGSMLFRFS